MEKTLDPNRIITNVVFSYERMEQENHALHEQVEFYRTELENIELQTRRVALRCVEKLEDLGYDHAADIVCQHFGIQLEDE
jgi:hypothetical protein